MSLDAVIEKIKKLRALAQSANANEAANAAAAAERLLQEHRLSEAELETEAVEPAEAAEEDAVPVDTLGERISNWKDALLAAICRAHGCARYFNHSYVHRGYVARIVGRPSDTATVRYLYAWLSTEVERLARKHGRGKGRTWANSYRLGCVAGIREAMQAAEAKARTTATSAALVRLDARAAEARDALVRLHPNLRSRPLSRTSVNGHAFGQGQHDGRNIHQGGHLPTSAGAKALKG